MRSAKDPPRQSRSRQSDQEAEQRRLSEAIRLLAADRDRLLARLNTLERSLDDVTGSIAAPTAQGVAADIRCRASRARRRPSRLPRRQRPRRERGSDADRRPASQNRVAAGHLATGIPSAAESVATKTEFGVDLGGNASIEGLRTLWSNLKASQPAMLEGLRPVIAIREGQRPGSIELRLVAGPLANASIAARLCAALAAAGQPCQPPCSTGRGWRCSKPHSALSGATG